MSAKLPEGTKVVVHSLGESTPGEFKGTICGLLYDYISKVYAVKLDAPEQLKSEYSVIGVPEGCIRVDSYRCDLCGYSHRNPIETYRTRLYRIYDQ